MLLKYIGKFCIYCTCLEWAEGCCDHPKSDHPGILPDPIVHEGTSHYNPPVLEDGGSEGMYDEVDGANRQR